MRLLKKGEFSPPRHKGRKDLLWTSFLLRALGVFAVPFFSGLRYVSFTNLPPLRNNRACVAGAKVNHQPNL